jgi:hypothetical protein
MDLHPAGGGAPVVVYRTAPGSDQAGKPHDITMTPDGQYAVVRSGAEVGLYRLDGASTHQVWSKNLFGDPGPFGSSAMDSVEATNFRIATISRRSNGAIGAQLDVFDMLGTQRYAYLDGDPHDVALTPDGTRVALRTHLAAYLFDVRRLPMQPVLQPLDVVDFAGTNTSYGAGLDSIVAGDTQVAAISRNSGTTKVAVWNIEEDRFAPFFSSLQPDVSLDLEMSSNGKRVIFSFLKSFLIVDLRTGQEVLRGDGTLHTGWPSWCDGVAINGTHAAAFGVAVTNGQGWISLIDLFEHPRRFCPTNPNSTGEAGELSLSGTPGVLSNDLKVWGTGLPSRAVTRLVYGDTATQNPFGAGFFCVGGLTAAFPLSRATPGGIATQTIDYGNLPQGGGAIVPGTTWYFQMVHRDHDAGTVNLTDALGVLFGA